MRRFDRSRAAALLLLAAVMAAVCAVIFVPAVTFWRAKGAQIVAARQSQHEIQAAHRSVDLLAQAGTRWRGFSSDPRAGFLGGDTLEMARETGRLYLTDAIERLGGNVALCDLTARTRTEEDSSRIDILEVEVTAILPKSALPEALFEMESRPPYVMVDRMTLSGSEEANVSIKLQGRAFRFRRNTQ